MTGFPLHRIGDKRLDGASTIDTGKQTKVMVEGKLAAVEGDKDDHTMLGDLISTAGGSVMIQGQKAIGALIDSAAPDQQGMIPHPQGLPTPAEGSSKVKIGMGIIGQALGMLGGGAGNKGGNMSSGENVKVGGQKVGDVFRFVDGGAAGFDVLVLANTSNTVVNGTIVVGETSGNTFTFTSYYTT